MGGCTWVAGAGGPPSTAIVKYFADGSVNLNMGASDIGTGTKTVMAMVVAEELGVKPETELEMESRLANQDLAFDGYEDDDDDAPSAPSTYLPDTRMEPARMLEREDTDRNQRERLYAALEGLDQRSKIILRERWLSEKKQTLHELAQQFNVSAERIRQIEKNAMKKLRVQLEL
jgi:RNA polymerase sigma-32 factor